MFERCLAVNKNRQTMFKLYKHAWVDGRPPHQHEAITPQEVARLLNGGGYLLNNSYDFDCVEETLFWHVIKDRFGGMEELSSKMRNQVKKSLKTYDVEHITAEEFRRIALPIYNAAQESYRVKAQLSKQEEIDRLARAENKEFWAVYVKVSGEGLMVQGSRDERVAVAVAINTVTRDETRWRGCAEYNTMKCDPKFQHNSTYPYYGLIYEMNRYYLEEQRLGYVNDGARSLTEHSNIQGFLIEKFNFRRAYGRVQIAYQWWFGAIVKVLYPFKCWIKQPQVAGVLRLEEIRRNQ